MKKYSSGSFVDAAVRVYGSEADTISSFPTTIYADGENASAVIYGNMVQSGTPTPASPIYPSECGELVSSNYTIPIISGGVTTSIDLSIASHSKTIEKIVLTGSETFQITSGGVIYTTPVIPLIAVAGAICSHYPYYPESQGPNMPINMFTTRGGAGSSLWFKTEYNTTDEFINFLQSEYSANHPVTVWYVRATATTIISNEPLRKIGNYADSVAAAAIPTTAGSQTFNIDTTLKPSSVSLTYTGWHTHSDKQYSGGSWGQVTSNAKKKKGKKHIL